MHNYVIKLKKKVLRELIFMARREHIPARLRHEVFQRDNYRCRECGATNKETTLEIDHIVPVSKGGTDSSRNLQALQWEENRKKSDTYPYKK